MLRILETELEALGNFMATDEGLSCFWGRLLVDSTDGGETDHKAAELPGYLALPLRKPEQTNSE